MRPGRAFSSAVLGESFMARKASWAVWGFLECLVLFLFGFLLRLSRGEFSWGVTGKRSSLRSARLSS